jgi:hypothetical protein
MKLKTIEDTDRLNYRLPVSIKTELDALAERCKRDKVDFIAALAENLHGFARAMRQELDNKAGQRGAKNGASVAPETYPNGGSK